MVDQQRFRAYWFRDELYFDVFAKTAGEPGSPASHWSFDAEVAGKVVDPVVCESYAPYGLGAEVIFAACHAAPLRVPSCGKTIRLDVRLSSSTHDSLGQEICMANGFGPPSVVEAVVECPPCPTPRPVAGMRCHHPRAGYCPAHSGSGETCSCGDISRIDEPLWGCPVSAR
jgi:hypothetical protein